MSLNRPSSVSQNTGSSLVVTWSPALTHCGYSSWADLHRDNLLPTEEELLAPRDSAKAFFAFTSYFLPCTVGKVEYNLRAPNVRVSEFVTVSDEAYTMIVIENSYKRWLAEANDPDKVNRENWPNALWTADPQGACLFNGWKREGITKYGKLMFAIRDRRELKDQAKLEIGLCKQLRIIAAGKRKRRTSARPPQEYFEECPDFDDPVPSNTAIDIDDSSDEEGS
jgi:hypothetical protein